MSLLAGIAAALAAAGLAQTLAGWRAVTRFASRSPAPAGSRPPVSVLKPLHGDEPSLEAALASCCAQDYPAFQVVFGVQRADDPALDAVRRVQARFPGRDIAVVIDPARHGANGKVGNLINMLPAARHDVLAIADSDVRAAPDTLARLADALEQPGTGLVTTLYAGVPVVTGLVARLGAMQINHSFLPGALLARAVGRQDCLGATMLLRRDALARIGGLRALADHLADDNALGRRIVGLGLAVRLADTVVATQVPERGFAALFRHEVRWARTIRALVPAAFAASALQYPLFWSLLAVAWTMGAWWACGLFALAWAVRALAARGVERALAQKIAAVIAGQPLAIAAPLWLLPLRELMSAVVLVAGFTGRRVDWRGHSMVADGPAAVPDRLPQRLA